MSTLPYSAEQVRLYDHDRFLTVILSRPAARDHLFALYAFNLEIAKIAEVVTEPLIGRIRLQWWRDALDRLYGGEIVAHEVARPLGAAIAAAGLNRALFDRLIDARERDLDATPLPDLAALEFYARETGSPLLELALQALGRAPGQPEISPAAGSIGAAWALTGLIRAVPFHASRRRLYLPLDLLKAANVRTGRLFDMKPDPGVAIVARAIGERALFHLEEGKAAIRSIPGTARAPLLLAELARLYLADLRRADWDPFAPWLRRGRPLALANLTISHVFNRL